MKRMLYILMVVACASCHSQVEENPKTIHACQEPPQGRASGMCFAQDSTVYVVGGRTQDGTFSQTMLIYDARQDKWTESASLPIAARVNGTVCVTTQGVFMGLGWAGGAIHNDSLYLRDWWRYDTQSDTWTPLADFPTDKTSGAVCWSNGEQIWVASGFHEFTNDIWRYEISSNRWLKALEESPERVMAPVAATCQGRYFYGTGFYQKSRSSWWEWTEDGRWTRRKDVPCNGRHNAACAATDKAVWVIGGWHYGDTLTTGFYYEDILRYEPTTDSWTLCGTLPCGTTENGMAAGIGNRIYFGLGEDKKGTTHKAWYYIED